MPIKVGKACERSNRLQQEGPALRKVSEVIPRARPRPAEEDAGGRALPRRMRVMVGGPAPHRRGGSPAYVLKPAERQARVLSQHGKAPAPA